MARLKQKLTLDAEDMEAQALTAALDRGVRAVALDELRRLQRADPTARLELRVRRQGPRIIAEVVALVAGDSAGSVAKAAGIGPPGTPPRRAVVRWVKARGLRPTDGKRHSDPATSVAVAIQRSLRKRSRLQRAAAAEKRSKKRASRNPERATGASPNLGRHARVMVDVLANA